VTARNPFDLPEVNVALFAFLLNLAWEFWQVPFFRDMAALSHWEGIKLCSLATAGDALIAVAAFRLAARAGRGRDWFLAPARREMAVFLLTGVAATVLFEALATRVLDQWQYGAAMPVLPVLGTGVVPVVQWLVIPPLVLWFVRRQLT